MPGIASAASLLFQLDDVLIVEEAADWFGTALDLQRLVLFDGMLASLVDRYFCKAVRNPHVASVAMQYSVNGSKQGNAPVV